MFLKGPSKSSANAFFHSLVNALADGEQFNCTFMHKLDTPHLCTSSTLTTMRLFFIGIVLLATLVSGDSSIRGGARQLVDEKTEAVAGVGGSCCCVCDGCNESGCIDDCEIMVPCTASFAEPDLIGELRGDVIDVSETCICNHLHCPPCDAVSQEPGTIGSIIVDANTLETVACKWLDNPLRCVIIDDEEDPLGTTIDDIDEGGLPDNEGEKNVCCCADPECDPNFVFCLTCEDSFCQSQDDPRICPKLTVVDIDESTLPRTKEERKAARKAAKKAAKKAARKAAKKAARKAARKAERKAARKAARKQAKKEEREKKRAEANP